MSYLNQDKLLRAKDAVSGKRKFTSESSESVALALGKEEGLKGDALVDFVYVKLGGAKTEEPVKKETKVGTIKEETSGKEVEEVKPKGRGGKK